jgi:hypothetical protein
LAGVRYLAGLLELFWPLLPPLRFDELFWLLFSPQFLCSVPSFFPLWSSRSLTEFDPLLLSLRFLPLLLLLLLL